MILRNAYNALATKLLGKNASAMIKSYSGSVASCGSATYGSAREASLEPVRLSTSYNGGYMVIGTGSKEPTFDDYKLSGSLITTFASTSQITSRTENGKVIWTAVYTITNTGSSAFTIREIAKCNDIYYNNSSGYYYVCLVERSLLAEPLTIPAGGVGQLTYEISIPIPEGFG